MTTTREAPPTYTFGRRDRGGLLLGFRLTQISAMGIGCTAFLMGLVSGTSHGTLIGVGVLVIFVTIAIYPVQGRAVVDWIKPLTAFAWARIRGRARYLGGPAALHRCGSVARIDLPGLGQRMRLYETETPEGTVAALRFDDRWTMVMRVRGSNYVLADRASQERRISAWGALLAQAGQEGTRIAAIQWLERTIPDSGHDLEDWWQDRGDAESPYAAAYANLIEKAGPAATRHETYLAVAIDSHKLRRSIKQAGGGPKGTTKVLLGELAWIRRSLAAADIEVVDTMGAEDLARLVRSQYDPDFSHDAPAPTPIAAGPMAAEGHWDHYRSDGGVHAVYWIAEWPSVPVEAAWIYPLVAQSGERRTLSVSCEPIAPSRSLRELRGQRVAKRADEAQRRRLGQVDTAQDDEEFSALERRERELVRGHTEYRITGWITVTGRDRDDLEASCARIEQAAVRSALEVRRVYGEVDQAFLRASLPITLGVA